MQQVQTTHNYNKKNKVSNNTYAVHAFLSFCLPLSLACRCGEKASQKGYTVFGLQFYGECWSGQNAEFNFNREGAAKDEKCVMNLNKPTECVQSSNQECVGTQWTNYVYKLTESKLNKAKKKYLGYIVASQNGSVSSLWAEKNSV